jgi:hypothetical protein
VANVLRPPFYVPSGQDEAVWQFRPRQSALLAPLLTTPKMFGAGGQVPTKLWRYDYFIDEPVWTGEPSAADPIPLLTEQKFFGAGGQVPTKRWQPFYNYDDASFWQGAPVQSPIISFLTQQKFFGQGGQVPAKQWQPFYNYDDASFWQGSPVNSPIIEFLTQQKFFGAGGQVPTKRWQPFYNYDDSSGWSYQFRRNLNTTIVATPFVNLPWLWRYDHDIGESFWQGKPSSSALLAPLLTALGQVKPFRWNFTFDDPPVWQPTIYRNLNTATFTAQSPFFNPPFASIVSSPSDDPPWQFQPPYNLTLVASLQFPVEKAGTWIAPDDAEAWQFKGNRNTSLLAKAPSPFIPLQYGFTVPDDSAYWQGQPVVSYTLQKLTAGGRPFNKQWRYDYDDASYWQFKTPYNLNIASITPKPFVPPQYGFTVPDDSSYWQGKSLGSALLGQLLTAVGKAKPFRWFFGSDDSSHWEGRPIKSAALSPLLTASKPIVNPPFRFGYDDAAYWIGHPIRSGAMSLPPIVTFFGAPGQAPTKFWGSFYNYDIGGEFFWQGGPVVAPLVLFPPTPIPPPPPPPPLIVTVKTYPIDGAFGNTLVLRFFEPNVYNPLFVGDAVAFLVETGSALSPSEPVSIILTKPDGSTKTLTFPEAYVGIPDAVTWKGIFLGRTYAVGTIILDQPGTWGIYADQPPVTSQPKTFFVNTP